MSRTLWVTLTALKTVKMTSRKKTNVKKTFKIPKQPTKRSKMDNIEEKMNEYFQQLTQKPKQDEYSLYTQLLCKKLQGMQEKTREIAMLEIDKLVFRLKQCEIQGHSSHSQTQTTSG